MSLLRRNKDKVSWKGILHHGICSSLLPEGVRPLRCDMGTEGGDVHGVPNIRYRDYRKRRRLYHHGPADFLSDRHAGHGSDPARSVSGGELGFGERGAARILDRCPEVPAVSRIVENARLPDFAASTPRDAWVIRQRPVCCRIPRCSWLGGVSSGAHMPMWTLTPHQHLAGGKRLLHCHPCHRLSATPSASIPSENRTGVGWAW